MKKLLVVLLLLAACSGGLDINETVSLNTTNTSSNTTGEEYEEIYQEAPELEEEDFESTEALLKKFKQQQQAIYMERAGVLKKMRNVSSKIYDQSLSFEEKQFYQKAYNILNQRKSELTLQATLLEEDINRLEKKLEIEEELKDVNQRLEELREQKDKYVSELEIVRKKVVNVRDEWLSSLDSENFTEIDEKLEELEDKQSELTSKLRDVVDDIRDKNELLEELEAYEISESRKDLMLKAQSIREELRVVRGKLVEQYLTNSSAAEELEEKEDELKRQLRNVTEELD